MWSESIWNIWPNIYEPLTKILSIYLTVYLSKFYLLACFADVVPIAALEDLGGRHHLVEANLWQKTTNRGKFVYWQLLFRKWKCPYPQGTSFCGKLPNDWFTELDQKLECLHFNAYKPGIQVQKAGFWWNWAPHAFSFLSPSHSAPCSPLFSSPRSPPS